MRTEASPTRRAVLASGLLAATALLVAGTSGCGLRLDRDPRLPALSAADVLRDAVARTLAAAEPASEPAVRTGLEAFAAAVGPPWNPPGDLRTPAPAPNPDPSPLAPLEALAEAVGLIARTLPDLPSGAAAEASADGDRERRAAARDADALAVLADVAAGALLHVRRGDAAAAAALTAEIEDAAAEVLRSLDSGRSAAEDEEDRAGESTGEDSPAGVLAGLVTAARQAEYAYERAAVHLGTDSPARAGAAARIASAASLAAQAGILMLPLSPPADRAAWELGTRPHDHDSALLVLQKAEDGIAAALLTARAQLPPAALLHWLTDTAAARERAGGPQDLRGAGTGLRHREEQE